MDLSTCKQDIDELIHDFSQGESTSVAEMRRVWASRKFTYIFEAAPTPSPYSCSNLAFFMQSLFAHSLGHIVYSASLFHRLGGLYCLYCLHETQPFKPPFRIYISLREVKSIRDLIVAAKEQGITVVLPLVKRMLDRNMFLFGALDVNEASFTERMNHLTELQNARVELAYKKLFSNTRIEQILGMDLGLEIDMDIIKKVSSEYSEAKTLAVKEARAVVDLHDIEHIAEDEKPIGNVVEGIVDEWNAESQAYHQHKAFSLDVTAEREAHLLEAPREQEDDDPEFEQRLEDILSEP